MNTTTTKPCHACTERARIAALPLPAEHQPVLALLLARQCECNAVTPEMLRELYTATGETCDACLAFDKLANAPLSDTSATDPELHLVLAKACLCDSYGAECIADMSANVRAHHLEVEASAAH